ncbi:MAG: biopolymer transporter ExbD [Spartobacteria bacterium]|nr:biopolymer transporter ExbD [Spartobacteria bacterium]
MKASTGPLFERIIHLKRKYRQENRIANGLIDSAPFIDLALLLFLFFMLTHMMILRPGIKLELPEAPFISGANYEAMVLFATQEGYFFFGDERTPLEGLEAAFAQAVHRNPDATLLIEADKRVPYDTLVHIYNKAHRAGIRDVVLGTRLTSSGKSVAP